MSVIHSWVGAVGDGSAWMRAKIDGSDGELYVATAADMSDETQAATGTATADGIVSLQAGLLVPDTQYYWEVRDVGDGTRSPTGRFHTHGEQGNPYSYRFAAFSCAGLSPDYPGDGDELAPNRISNHPAFDDVRSFHPLFVAHLGDAHYYNLGGTSSVAAGDGTVANYRRAYDDVLDQPRQHQLYREVPLVYCWDDHDYGPNNSDGTYADKANAAQVYRERVPHYTLAESSGPIYHSFQVGRVLHLVTDTRYHRSPNDDEPSPSKTMLGQAQKDWIDSLLGSTSAELLVWHNSSVWMASGPDSWGSFPYERDELVQLFGDRGFLNRMCIISGDAHMLGIDTGGGNDWGNFPIFQLASIDSTPAASVSHSYDTGDTQPGRGQYGIMEVDDRGKTIKIIGTGWDPGGRWRAHTFFTADPVTVVPLLGLDYQAQHISPPFEPTEDDQQLRNDVTAERDGGSSSRSIKQSGPLSVAEVGRYDESATLNVYEDGQLPDQASWRVHLGTVDEPRYPDVTVSLTRNQNLIRDVARVESGDRFTISNVPAWLPPGQVELLAQGYEERITPFEWEWTANTSPASPWTVGVLGHDSLGRLDTSGSELATPITSSDIAADVAITAGPIWVTDTAELPLLVEVGGEVIEVTSITGASSPQTFGITRSINGISKGHSAGAAVQLAQPLILGL